MTLEQKQNVYTLARAHLFIIYCISAVNAVGLIFGMKSFLQLGFTAPLLSLSLQFTDNPVVNNVLSLCVSVALIIPFIIFWQFSKKKVSGTFFLVPGIIFALDLIANVVLMLHEKAYAAGALGIAFHLWASVILILAAVFCFKNKDA